MSGATFQMLLAGSAKLARLTFVAQSQVTTSSATQVHSVNVGPGGTVVVEIAHRGTGSPTGGTIGGQTATLLIGVQAGTIGRGILVATGVPSGVQTVSITLSASSGFGSSISTYTLTGCSTPTVPTFTGNSNAANPTATFNVPAGGCAIGVADTVLSSAGVGTASWGGTAAFSTDTQNFWDGGNIDLFSTGHANYVAAQTGITSTCTFTGSTGTAGGVFAVWGP